MKLKSNVYAPLFFGAILLLVGFAPTFSEWITHLSEEIFFIDIIVLFLVFLLPLAFYCRVRNLNLVAVTKVKLISLKKIPLILVLFSIFAVGSGILRYFGIFYLDGAFSQPRAMIGSISAGNTDFLSLICCVFLPAALEQTVFFGILLEEYRPYGTFWAVGISSLMFAMAHLSAESFLYYLFMGLVLALVCVVSDSIVPGVILHSLIHFFQNYLGSAIRGYLEQAGKTPLLPYLLIAALLVLFVFLFARFETIYHERAYDEMLQTRKELLRKELERVREEKGGADRQERHGFVASLCEIYLSPTLLASFAVFFYLVFGIFS